MKLCLGLAIAAAQAPCTAQTDQAPSEPGRVSAHSQGLHGYLGFHATSPPRDAGFGAGVSFYSAVWPLVEQPIANLQIGLASSWILPDNSDNRTEPLAPQGTLARTWPERGPTWDSVFQTIEGGLGYWAGNHFRYGPPKFSMNATPQCYDYEIGSPGWSFFYDDQALPDHRLGIAQLSNRLLIPPDGLPFAGKPNGEFLGYAWMALPLTDPIDAADGKAPTGDQSWTCFLHAENFKGPIAYYIPQTWSKIGTLFEEPFLFGRGLDARAGTMGGGAMEINTVPRFDSTDANGVRYSKIPRLQFPINDERQSILVQNVKYYSRSALFDAIKAWRDGGPACSGRFDEDGTWSSTLSAQPTRYTQDGKDISGIDAVLVSHTFEGNVWGVAWPASSISPVGDFPQYYKQVGDHRVPIAAAEVPAETGLIDQHFDLAQRGPAYTSPAHPNPEPGAWTKPGPASAALTARLADGSTVTYAWYRFVDQPSLQQYAWSEAQKASLQALVEKMHASWPIDGTYMAPPTRGKLVTLDPGLLVTPPAGMEVGYVPIVIGQH
jgi:hypothetical protein